MDPKNFIGLTESEYVSLVENLIRDNSSLKMMETISSGLNERFLTRAWQESWLPTDAVEYLRLTQGSFELNSEDWVSERLVKLLAK
jgi:hypothetical protein